MMNSNHQSHIRFIRRPKKNFKKCERQVREKLSYSEILARYGEYYRRDIVYDEIANIFSTGSKLIQLH